MPQFAYFNGVNSMVQQVRSDTLRVAAEQAIQLVPAEHRWQTNVTELMRLPVGASLDLTDEPQRTIRREF